jgi:hypothetical protein
MVAHDAASSHEDESGLPVMHGDSSWIECDDGTLAVSITDRRAPDGATRMVHANLFVGTHRMSGPIAGSGAVRLHGGTDAFVGNANIDWEHQTVALVGRLRVQSIASSVHKTLSCTSLGANFEADQTVVPTNAIARDGSWLLCYSATVLANVFEQPGEGVGDRTRSITVVADGDSLVFGEMSGSGTVRLGIGGSADSFQGNATVRFNDGSSMDLRGTYTMFGTAYDVNETLMCKRLLAPR